MNVLNGHNYDLTKPLYYKKGIGLLEKWKHHYRIMLTFGYCFHRCTRVNMSLNLLRVNVSKEIVSEVKHFADEHRANLNEHFG